MLTESRKMEIKSRAGDEKKIIFNSLLFFLFRIIAKLQCNNNNDKYKKRINLVQINIIHKL